MNIRMRTDKGPVVSIGFMQDAGKTIIVGVDPRGWEGHWNLDGSPYIAKGFTARDFGRLVHSVDGAA